VLNQYAQSGGSTATTNQADFYVAAFPVQLRVNIVAKQAIVVIAERQQN
jgi:hypothetical protein